MRARFAVQDGPVSPRQRELLRLTLGPCQQHGYVAAVNPKECPEGRRLSRIYWRRGLGCAPAATALGDGDRPPGFKDRGFATQRVPRPGLLGTLTGRDAPPLARRRERF
jgi:hypothetical protein